MKIVHFASEVVPFAKTGGLGDVAGALPLALAKEGHEAMVILPYYTKKISEVDHKIKDEKITFKIPMGSDFVSAEIYSSRVGPKVKAYLIKQDKYFDRDELYNTVDGDYPDNAERFAFFTRVALSLAANIQPDIIHLHDWQTAIAAVYGKTIYRKSAGLANTKYLLTIHNLGYQGIFPKDVLPKISLSDDLFTPDKLEHFGNISFLKAGINFADAISTVSKKYAEEILTDEYGCGLNSTLSAKKDILSGIVNGIDYKPWNPEKDKLIPANFTPAKMNGKSVCKAKLQKAMGLPENNEVPLLGIVSRLASQKGFDLFETIMTDLMKEDIQMVVLGTGEQRYHDMFTKFNAEYPQKLGVRIGFDNTLAHLIEAGSDMFLMPSHYEPCGLNQMISLKYGTIPVVRATGGLDDTIKHRENGFKFGPYDAQVFLACIKEALEMYKDKESWNKIVQHAMSIDFSWGRSAREYVELYEKMTGTGP